VPEMRELLEALAPLEHQVLEQVREPRASLRLGAEADVDVHRDADDGGGRVRDDENPQPVGQRRPMQFWRRHAAECSPLRGTPAYPASARSTPVPDRQSTYSKSAAPSGTTDTSWYRRRRAAGPSYDRYRIAAPKIATCVRCDSAHRSSASRLCHQLSPNVRSTGLPSSCTVR
jgi:hypothetical protein